MLLESCVPYSTSESIILIFTEMASSILKHPIQTVGIINPSIPLPQNNKILCPSVLFSSTSHSHNHISSLPPTSFYKNQKLPPLYVRSSLSSPTPPTSKEEAILQAKTCLSITLEKPLNNPKLAGKLKKFKQPRFRVEIPVIDDDSPSSVSQFAFDVFKDLSIRRRGSPVKILILWPDIAFTEAAVKVFEPPSLNQVEHVDVKTVTDGDYRIASSADVAIFFAPEKSNLAIMKTVTDCLYPKPAVIFNPRWGFEEEETFGDKNGFVGSFEVIYSFTGLEVKGILSKRKGVIFKHVRDGVLSGERWNVLVEEEGELKVVSKFKARPSIGEVETVLYNLMASNSPITKSAKFFRDFVSNVTGKK